jgi:DNA sulfur modification protein DndB
MSNRDDAVGTFSPAPAATKPAKVAEFKKRRRPFEEKRIPTSELADYEQKGWTKVRDLNRGVRVRRHKGGDEILENQFWCLLYSLGFDELNIGRRFFVTVEQDGNRFKRQIDVFAKDDETIIVAECKTADELKGKRLQRELGDFDSLKRPIANALRAHYGKQIKHKIIWLFVTSRIRWHQSDLARAREANISIITDRELRYYTEIAKALGPAARYQFHAEFLTGQKIPALRGRRTGLSRLTMTLKGCPSS